MAALLGLGALIMTALHRRGDIVTTGITTAVVMVVAAMSPGNALQQPLLRLVDTLFGIAIGVVCKWVGSYLFSLAEHDLGDAEVHAAQIGRSRSTSRFDTEHKGEIK
jgi:divalent metal cation (Fe/Co/Zn/Cd) transporter